MSVENISRYLDHAVLKPEMTRDEAIAAIELGIEYRVRTVCVRPCDIDLAVRMCRGTETEVSCVLSFPHGCGMSAVKADEAKRYIAAGVNEIDMVANYGFIRSGLWEEVTADIQAVTNVTIPSNVLVKVIFETCQLNTDQIIRATECSIEAKAGFVKTSTGFSDAGATVEAVKTMIDTAAGRIDVKPSGGIRDRATAEMYIEMGAKRLGNGYSSTRAICDGPAAAGAGSQAETY